MVSEEGTQSWISYWRLRLWETPCRTLMDVELGTPVIDGWAELKHMLQMTLAISRVFAVLIRKSLYAAHLAMCGSSLGDWIQWVSVLRMNRVKSHVPTINPAGPITDDDAAWLAFMALEADVTPLKLVSLQSVSCTSQLYTFRYISSCYSRLVIAECLMESIALQ